jgi:hypothetical protein
MSLHPFGYHASLYPNNLQENLFETTNDYFNVF